MTIHRVIAFLKLRPRARLVELPARQGDYRLMDSVVGVDPKPTGGWREVGREPGESIL